MLTCCNCVSFEGYRQIAQLVFQACVEMADSVKQVAQLQLVVEPQVNVVCFRTNPVSNYPRSLMNVKTVCLNTPQL